MSNSKFILNLGLPWSQPFSSTDTLCSSTLLVPGVTSGFPNPSLEASEDILLKRPAALSMT